MASMGRYGNGNGAYDRSFYLQLWSAPRYIIRDLKSVRSKLMGPLLQINMNAHVSTTVASLLRIIIFENCK